MLHLPISRRVVQIYQSCWTSRRHLFGFINISDNSRLINSNLLQRSKISVVEDNEVRSEEESTSKQAHVKLLNKQPSDIWFHQVLRCFRVVWSQFWTSWKCLLALETSTNNPEVKRSLKRLQTIWIIYPKIIFARAWPPDLSPSCATLPVLLNFKNRSIWIYKYQWPWIINKLKHIGKKIFDFLLSFKGFRFNKLEISILEAVTTQYWIGLWSAE